jgi:hypothetical protein
VTAHVQRPSGGHSSSPQTLPRVDKPMYMLPRRRREHNSAPVVLRATISRHAAGCTSAMGAAWYG